MKYYGHIFFYQGSLFISYQAVAIIPNSLTCGTVRLTGLSSCGWWCGLYSYQQTYGVFLVTQLAPHNHMLKHHHHSELCLFALLAFFTWLHYYLTHISWLQGAIWHYYLSASRCNAFVSGFVIYYYSVDWFRMSFTHPPSHSLSTLLQAPTHSHANLRPWPMKPFASLI